MTFLESPDMRIERLLREGDKLMSEHNALFDRIVKMKPGPAKSKLTIKLVKLYKKIDAVKAALKAESHGRPGKI